MPTVCEPFYRQRSTHALGAGFSGAAVTGASACFSACFADCFSDCFVGCFSAGFSGCLAGFSSALAGAAAASLDLVFFFFLLLLGEALAMPESVGQQGQAALIYVVGSISVSFFISGRNAYLKKTNAQ